MSLTSNEWEELWAAIKAIEYVLNNTVYTTQRKQAADKAVIFIKDKVEQVIGQME